MHTTIAIISAVTLFTCLFAAKDTKDTALRGLLLFIGGMFAASFAIALAVDLQPNKCDANQPIVIDETGA